MTRRTQMTNAAVIERCASVSLSCPWAMRFSTTRILPRPPYSLFPSSTDESIPPQIYKTKAMTSVSVCPEMTGFGLNNTSTITLNIQTENNVICIHIM